MNPPSLFCQKCKRPLPTEIFNLPDLRECPSCGNVARVHVFPALFHSQTPSSSESILSVEGEAGCFYHPHKKAVVPCDMCGRFLCGLCDVELNGRHLCSSCIETGKKKHKFKNLENQRILYGHIALALAFWSLLFWPITIVTAPAAIFIALWHWKSPSSIVFQYKSRHILAVLLAALQIAAWSGMILLIIRKAMTS